MASQPAAAAEAFIQSLGVNTHIDFFGGPYGNLAAVESALNYLGLPNVRDSAANPGDLGAWQQVSQATGVKFQAFIGQVPPSAYGYQLATMEQAAGDGLLNAVEGANEPDFAGFLGQAAGFQPSVWQLGQRLGLPVVNTSFGNVANYGVTGDLAAWANDANAHIYFGTGNNPAWAGWIAHLEALAQSSARSRPVVISETGYYTSANFADPSNVDATVQAKYTLDLVLDAWQSGAPRSYLYELLDQATGSANPGDNFGLFRSDGSAKPAATAIHDLVTLLHDPGGAGTPGGSLDYSLSGLQSTDHAQLFSKSDGTAWLAVWNDTRLSGPFNAGETAVPPHSVTLTLGTAASQITVFDPLNGTGAVQTAANTSTLSFALPDHPILIEVAGSGNVSAPPPSPPPPVPPAPAGAQQIAQGDAQSVVIASGAVINASAGDHWIFLGGTGDTLTATGGTETVLAFKGGNTITTGAGNDTLRFAGTANTIDAGAGSNRLEDSGAGNTIVLPAAASGHDDVLGWTMQNGDTFDLRAALARTGWSGDPASLGHFVQVTMSGNDCVVSIDPSGSSGAAGSAVATLHSSGAMDLTKLLAHAVTR